MNNPEYQEDDPQGDFLKGFKFALSIGASAAVLALVFTAAKLSGLSLNDGKHAVLVAAMADESHERACIAQYGPGERHVHRKPACALGTRDVPAEVLSYPLGQ